VSFSNGRNSYCDHCIQQSTAARATEQWCQDWGFAHMHCLLFLSLLYSIVLPLWVGVYWISYWDRLPSWAGIPHQYVTKPSRSTELCVPLGSLNWVPALNGWINGGNVTSAGWQVTLCDPIWCISSRSSDSEACYELLLQVNLLLLYFTVITGCVQILESHWNKPDSCQIFDLCTCFRPLYALSLFTVRLGSICCLV